MQLLEPSDRSVTEQVSALKDRVNALPNVMCSNRLNTCRKRKSDRMPTDESCAETATAPAVSPKPCVSSLHGVWDRSKKPKRQRTSTPC